MPPRVIMGIVEFRFAGRQLSEPLVETHPVTLPLRFEQIIAKLSTVGWNSLFASMDFRL